MEMNESTAKEEVNDGIAVIYLDGEIDLNNISAIKEKLSKHIDNLDRPLLILEMSAVRYVDSTMVGVIIGAIKRAKAKGGSLAIIAPSQQVKAVLRMTKIEELFPIFDSVESAKVSFLLL